MKPIKKLKTSVILVFVPLVFSFQTLTFEAKILDTPVKYRSTIAGFLTEILSSIKLSTQTDFSQSAEDGVREYLGEDRYAYLAQNNPGLISDLILRYAYGVQLIDWQVEKEVPYKTLSKVSLIFKESSQELNSDEFVSLFESGQINPLRVDLPMPNSQQSFFILANTGKALVMNSWQQMRYLQQSATN